MEFNNRFVTAPPRVAASAIIWDAAGEDVARSERRITTTDAGLILPRLRTCIDLPGKYGFLPKMIGEAGVLLRLGIWKRELLD